jgi:hypothetical protein
MLLQAKVKDILTKYNEDLVERLNFKHTTLWEILIAKGVVQHGDVEDAKVSIWFRFIIGLLMVVMCKRPRCI